jgi:enoyl-CoA hydratase
MASDILTYTLEGNVAIVRMDDGKANALSETMIESLLGALTRAEKEANAMVLMGRPDRFCAGFDLRVMMSSPDAAKALLVRGSELLLRLYGARVPLVIGCTGHALAGGALVLLSGDVRIGAEGAYKIGLNELSIGMPLPVLAMEFARDRLATTELTHATLLARIYGPEEAAKVGYLDSTAAADAVFDLAKAEATRLAGLARTPFEATKERLRGKTIAHCRATQAADMKALMTPA